MGFKCGDDARNLLGDSLFAGVPFTARAAFWREWGCGTK